LLTLILFIQVLNQNTILILVSPISIVAFVQKYMTFDITTLVIENPLSLRNIYTVVLIKQMNNTKPRFKKFITQKISTVY
jgi:hypothetical protein